VLPYGKTKGGLHNDGINIAASNGTDIRAAAKGRVVYAGNEMQGFGNLILIRHDNGFTSFYGHCGTMTVKRGNHVKQGDIIGTVGSTGNVTKPQLHFELRKKTTLVNPSDYVSP
jgi:murein DD-endopeptidase MepM/ murein hydrolase activator NlpD